MKLFLSTPISCYTNQTEYVNYRNTILHFVRNLRLKFEVYSEIEEIENLKQFDSPDESLLKDFSLINNCDCFILHYPKKLATSALVELGFALANNKKIIVITTSYSILPYLIQGIPQVFSGSIILVKNNLDDELASTISSILL